jgi:enediyne biosynthesis protein E4
LGEDEYNTFYMKLLYGYNYQYTRNNLQLNNRNNTFSEIGLFAGVAASDWSWAPLWIDFDNDGYKDLFISNGIPKRLNDIDYVNYISADAVQAKINANKVDEKEMAVVDKFPQIKLPNKFYKNNTALQFADIENAIENSPNTFSNGAAYADFDNDGDIDIVVNNIDDNALLYKNNSTQNDTVQKSISIQLQGLANNINAIGTKVIVYQQQQVKTYESFAAKGFQASMQIPVTIGIGNTTVDSIHIIWPNNTIDTVAIKGKLSGSIVKKMQPNLPLFNYEKFKQCWQNTTAAFTDITAATALNFTHTENPFNEFDREFLMPFMVSREGPALSVGDVNNDGLEDVFLGNAKLGKAALCIQQNNGKFLQRNEPALQADSMYEDVASVIVDVNNDGFKDVVVASGGNEFYGSDAKQQPRVYINNGKQLQPLANAFTNVFVTASCIEATDINNDGYTDLIIGARAQVYNYGAIPQSYILLNNGKGIFTNVTLQVAPAFEKIGMVKNIALADINGDKENDFIVATEWGGIYGFVKKGNSYTKQTISNLKGWWNNISVVDIDKDGDQDFIAGNVGLNSRLKPSNSQPVSLYYNDFDNNGKKEQIVTYYLNNKEIPFANKAELEKQMPILKKKFLYAEDFAKASLADLFGTEKLQSAEKLTANYFANSIFINNGKGQFTCQALPQQAQFSSIKTAIPINANNDALSDVLLLGNFEPNNIQMGRYDANNGLLLINKGNNQFTTSSLNGINIKGEARRVAAITINKKQAYIIARNNASAIVITAN